MPPVKGDKIPSTPLNTSAQIQQIFAEVQAQLPSVDFDTDDSNDAPEHNEVKIFEISIQFYSMISFDSFLNRPCRTILMHC